MVGGGLEGRAPLVGRLWMIVGWRDNWNFGGSGGATGSSSGKVIARRCCIWCLQNLVKVTSFWAWALI